MSSLSSLPGLKYGTFLGGPSTLSPVFGLRPFRGSRWRSRKLPKPRSSIFSPRCNASMMLLKTVSTMTSECFFVRSETRDTSSTSSAFVMLPPFIAVTPGRTKGKGQRAKRAKARCDPRSALCPVPCALCPDPLPVSEVIAERGRPVSCALLVALPIGPELVRLQRANRESDLPLLGRELDDLHRVSLPDLQIDFLFALTLPRVVELGDVDQALDPFVQLDEGAEVRHPHDLSFDRAADVVPREEVVPDIGRELLQPKRQPLVFGIDVQHHRVDHVALLQDLGRVLDALAPRHVGDVNQAVDILFDFDERAELGQVADLPLDPRADRVLVGQIVPRIALDLLQAERNAPRGRVDAQHHRVDRIADVENLRWVLDALAPRHLGHMDQPLDTRLELHEGTVIGQADDLAADPRANRIPIHHIRPRIGDELLVAE